MEKSVGQHIELGNRGQMKQLPEQVEDSNRTRGTSSAEIMQMKPGTERCGWRSGEQDSWVH